MKRKTLTLELMKEQYDAICKDGKENYEKLGITLEHPDVVTNSMRLFMQALRKQYYQSIQKLQNIK